MAPTPYPTTIQSLPPELIAAILECLQSDKNSLKSCTLVCSAWLNPSRSCLWHEAQFIGFQQPLFYNNFMISLRFGDLINIGQHIRKLTLVGPNITEGYNVPTGCPARPLSTTVLIAILDQLKNLRKLELQDFNLALDLSTSYCRKDIFSNSVLETLVLIDVMTDQSSSRKALLDFLPIIFPSLKELRASAFRPDDDIDVEGRPLSGLRHLSVNLITPSDVRFCRRMLMAQPIRRLDLFAFSTSKEQKFLASGATSIQYLSLHLVNFLSRFNPKDLNLTSYTVLESLDISIEVPSGITLEELSITTSDLFKFIVSTLTSIAMPPQLETLVLRLGMVVDSDTRWVLHSEFGAQWAQIAEAVNVRPEPKKVVVLLQEHDPYTYSQWGSEHMNTWTRTTSSHGPTCGHEIFTSNRFMVNSVRLSSPNY
ncbi:unnamed protein product [Somion occarium]|uniref:F-box domain-containing protein n=1 Tax=Somion occarium TaxID=3059160 RepID=A0ABP1DPU5_9APHY